MQLKLALPKGRLLRPTAGLLRESGLEISGYDDESRSYRPECKNHAQLAMKIFNERDVPIQVAVGNYDLGVCGGDWVEELMVKYAAGALVKVKDLGYGNRELSLAVSRSSQLEATQDLANNKGRVRIATEYPNIAESFALNMRLRRFSIIPVWGAAEAYPPESADVALIPQSDDDLPEQRLLRLSTIFRSNAFLIAHRASWESKNMGPLLERLYAAASGPPPSTARAKVLPANLVSHFVDKSQLDPTAVWLALPDGHQQAPVLQFLERAGVHLTFRPQEPRRPGINVEGVCTKIVRPQDMPLQVANGNFDLAITGEDWLSEHLYRFPSSPVKKVLRLGLGMVRIVAIVSKKLPFDSTEDLRSPLRRHSLATLRIASEYVNIADKYARDNHLSPYHLLPTWGASEAFLPEDADVLIENTQTGRTIAQHNLKIIDTLFESSACVITNEHAPNGSESKRKKIDDFIGLLSRLAHQN